MNPNSNGGLPSSIGSIPLSPTLYVDNGGANPSQYESIVATSMIIGNGISLEVGEPSQLQPMPVSVSRWDWGTSTFPTSSLKSPPKKKKKIPVVDAIILGNKLRLNKIKQKIIDSVVNQKMEERLLKQKEILIEGIKKEKISLANDLKLLNKNKLELKKHYQSVIDLLLKDDQIANFDTDMYQRIIITTKPILINKLGWLMKKEAGIYKIRIDFNENYFGNAIKILNTTRHYLNHDSPTIKNTEPCWGNIGPDIENDFNSQNLYELVKDLIDYIRSSNTQSGYLGKDGDKSKGWEQFFDNAILRPKNFSFSEPDLLTENEVLSAERYTATNAHTHTRSSLNNLNSMGFTGGIRNSSYELEHAIARLGFLNYDVITQTILNSIPHNHPIVGGRLFLQEGSRAATLEIYILNHENFRITSSLGDLSPTTHLRLLQGEILNFSL